MNNWNPNSNFTPVGYGKPIIEEIPSKFWTSEKGAAAARELLVQLTQGPKLLAKLGTYVKVPGKLIEFLADSCPVENEIRYDDKDAEWCGLIGKDENYWSIGNSISFSKEKRNTHTIESSSKIPPVKVLYYWGVLSTEAAIFDGENIALKDAGNENESNNLGGASVSISFPKLPPRFIKDFATGDFITASRLADEPLYLWYNIQRNLAPFMVRTWEDFNESGTYESLDVYLNSANENVDLIFTPKYSTKYPKILIHDHGKLYAGFQYNRKDNNFHSHKIVCSIQDFLGIESFGQSFRIVNYPICRIRFGDDEFTLVVASNWKTYDEFLTDSKFWNDSTPATPQPDPVPQPSPDPVPQPSPDPVPQPSPDPVPQPSPDPVPQPSPDPVPPTPPDPVPPTPPDPVPTASETPTQNAPEQSMTDQMPTDAWPKREIEFLQGLLEDAKRCGYEYNPQDIIRFHTSVKCGMFTLLGGAPGSGKSSLAALYARAALGTNNPEELRNGFLAIDVNPAWMEPDDILGHWNLKGKYSCASSGLVPFMRNNQNSTRLAIVCLEEMNLARVEHYFSSFIQAMSRQGEENVLHGVPSRDYSDSKEMDIPDLQISDNLRFVGTSNFDETTQRYSNRFYDRCNYLELQQVSGSNAFPDILPSFAKGKFASPIIYEEYQSWKKGIEDGQLDSEVIKLYEKLLPSFQSLNLSPSKRVAFAIKEYILNRPFFPGCGSDFSSRKNWQIVALDEAIVQRILPRYSMSFLHDDVEKNAKRELLDILKAALPLSFEMFYRKCNPGERPYRT